MNESSYFEILYNINGQIFYELQRLRKSLQLYNSMAHMMYEQLYRFNRQNYILQNAIARMQQPVNIENLYLSHDVNLEQLKVNSIQSGAALNIGEWICSSTNSHMQMEMGSNSMNSGDCNEMRCCDDGILRDENEEQP